MPDRSQRLAQAVRGHAPRAHCFACLAGKLGFPENVLRDAAQLLVVREPFIIQRRACSLCLKVRDLLVLK